MKTINKTNKTKLIGIAAFAIMLIAMFSFFLIGCSLKRPHKPENDFSAEFVNTEHVKLSISSAVTNAADNSVSKTLTATVLPATATNKEVDWSVEWGESTATGNVTDYVIVTPSAAGSTTATVTCKKAFTGTIIINVITRESGYSASCVITFVGIPTEIALSGSVTASENTFKLGIGKAYDFSIELSNPFNSVGSQFSDFSYTLTGVGTMVLGYMEHYNRSGADKWYDESNKTVTLDSLKNSFLKVNCANGKLTVTTIKSIESYYSSFKSLDGGRTIAYTDKFRSFVDDCYFRLIIKENVSGLTKEYQLRFENTIVTGVDISGGELQF